MSPALKQATDVLDGLDNVELAAFAVRVVLAVGMVPVTIELPPPVEGTSWRTCYERGLERLAHPKGLS